MRLAAALSPLAAPAHAQSFDGAYGADPAECGNALHGGRVTVAGGATSLHGSRCDLLNPVPVRGMGGATLFDMACAGEGEAWTRRVLLMRAEGGGLALVQEGGAMTAALHGGGPVPT